MNTPTPETDALQQAFNDDDSTAQNAHTLQHYCDMADLARKLERERDMWKANHDNQVELKRTLMDRPDLGERAKRMQELIAERDQLRKVCDAGHEILHWYIKEYGMPKWGFEFDKLKAIDKAYNQLPHVKEKTK